MEKISGLDAAFKEARQVLLTTFDEDGEARARAMTNFNSSAYERMWFPSFKDTRKIADIELDPNVVVSFPADEEGQWYRVEGTAVLAPWEEVREMWKWWLLEWLPEEDRRPLRYDNPFLDRSVIWVTPVKASISGEAW